MEIYAIGHSNYSVDRLIDMLKDFNIQCVVDIRGVPYSKFNVQFNKETLRETLIRAGFKYIYMGIEFGVIRETKESYTKEGYADFEKVIEEERFLRGIERLKKGLEMGYNIALLGAMQEPIRCHRSILVGRYLENIGIKVNYILDDESIDNQRDIENKLLDKYFTDRNQLTIDTLLGNLMSKEEMIKEAYRKANREIGYRSEKL